MKKISRIIITVAILIVSLAIGYYFIILLPQERKTQRILENQIKCGQMGYALYEKEKNENKLGTYLQPEFKFNEELNTCLYKGGYITSTYMEQFIKNVYTNQSIVVWSEALGIGNYQTFNEEYSKLFLLE